LRLDPHPRRFAPTEAGERLLQEAGPRLDELDAEPVAPGELCDQPSGTIRITAHDHAVHPRNVGGGYVDDGARN
jgi:DNA-binding transcriptional LysR family regulator